MLAKPLDKRPVQRIQKRLDILDLGSQALDAFHPLSKPLIVLPGQPVLRILPVLHRGIHLSQGRLFRRLQHPVLAPEPGQFRADVLYFMMVGIKVSRHHQLLICRSNPFL